MRHVVVLLLVGLCLPSLVFADDSLGAGMAAYHAGNYEEAFRIFTIYAEQGDAAAQYKLGVMYEIGEGVPENDAEAVQWYRKAAEQGSVEAKARLGAFYLLGRAVEHDPNKALRWIGEAAEQGHAGAQSLLGFLYQEGVIVPLDVAEAVAWYRKAAEQGYLPAQFKLGWLYFSGEGVPTDFVEAHRWLSLVVATDPELRIPGFDENAVAFRNRIEERMTPEQIAEAQRLATESHEIDYSHAGGPGGAGGWIAKVNGSEVSLREFLRRARMQSDNYRRLFGQEYDQALVTNEVIGYLVRREIMCQEAEKAGLTVTPRETADRIFETFSGPDGNFIGAEQYEGVVRRNWGVGTETFESWVADDVLADKWKDRVTQHVRVTEDEIEALYRARTEKTTIDYAVVASADQEDDLEITDEEVQAWYHAHQEDYRRAAGRKLVVESELASEIAPLADVANRVRADLLNQRLRDLALANARRAFERRGSFDAAVKSLELEQQESGYLAPDHARLPATGGTSPELRAVLFGDAAGEGDEGVVPVPAGALIYRVTRREPFDRELYEDSRETLRTELIGQRRVDVLNQLLSGLLQGTYNIEYNTEELARYTGQPATPAPAD
jgi:tetratricopeptide (TPR) repeat protein